MPPPQAVFHMLLLVWTHSKHYNTSARLVPLLRLIVEDVIAQCRKHLPGLYNALARLTLAKRPCILTQSRRAWSGQELLQMEAAEALDKLQLALRVIAAFLASMDEYRARSIRTVPGNPWRYSASAVCGHLDIFRQRLMDLQAMAGTAAQYARLERIEIGGSQVGCCLARSSADSCHMC